MKTNFKILLVLGIVFLAVLLFSTNTVKAADLTIELVNNIEWVESATGTQYEEMDVRCYNKETGTYEYKTYDYSVSIRLLLKNNNLTLEEFKNIQKYLKDNNMTELLQKIKLDIPDDVTKVKNVDTNEEYTILDNAGDKYIEYDVKVARIFEDVSDIITFYEATNVYLEGQQQFLQYTKTDGTTKSVAVEGVVNEAIGLYSDFNTVYDTYIGDDKGQTLTEKFKIKDYAYATSRRSYILRGAGGLVDEYSAQTTINYTDDYIYFGIAKYKADNIKVNFNNGNGINKETTFAYWKTESDTNRNFHIYRTEITTELENLLFSKPQTVQLTYKAQDTDFGLPCTFSSLLEVEGTARSSVKLNDKEVKIDFNGVLPMGVSIKSETIKENTEIFTTLTTTGINNLEKKYGVKNLTYISIDEIYTVGGKIDGAIQLTFDVGEQYNGRYVYIAHKLQNGGYECFKEKVENGKVSIVVYELSPFMVAVEKIPTQPGDGTISAGPGEIEEDLDTSPKMGVYDVNIFASLLAVISVAGIVITKKVK